jgi:hypothetical protein
MGLELAPGSWSGGVGQEGSEQDLHGVCGLRHLGDLGGGITSRRRRFSDTCQLVSR